MQPIKNVGPQIFDKRFIYLEILGCGAYGEVYKVQHRQTQKIYAIKKYSKIFSNRILALRTLRELSILRRMKHPKIIKIYDILPPPNIHDFNELQIVLEYLPMDLRKLYRKNKHLEDEHVVKITYQLLVVLKYLSSVKILHRDLKPENILSDNDFNIKLCDFGLARSGIAEPTFNDLNNEHQSSVPSQTQTPLPSSESSKKFTLHVVSRWYRAPEIILMQTKYDASIQIWSVGCILGELIAQHKSNKKIKITKPRKALFQGKACFPLSPPKGNKDCTYKIQNGFPHSEDDQISKILQFVGTPSAEQITFVEEEVALNYLKSLPKYERKRPSEIFEYCLPEWQDFLQKALVFDPRKRMSIDQALKHPIFDKIRRQEDFKFNEGFNLDISLPSDMPMQDIKQKLIEQIKYYSCEMDIQ